MGYEWERQAGQISAHEVDRRNNGLYANEQYAITPRIFVSGGARYQHSSTFGDEFAPRGAVIITHRSDVANKVDRAVFPGEQGGPRACLGQCNRGGQARRPAADNQGVINPQCVVHAGTINGQRGIFKSLTTRMFSPICAAERRNDGYANIRDS
jgi:hypothetical protein